MPEQYDANNLPQIDGIELVESLERVRGNWPILEKILFAFSDHQKNNVDEIKAALSANDQANATSIAHTLKGSGANIGANDLAAIAAKVEAGLKKGENIEGMLPELQEQLQRVVASIEGLKSGQAKQTSGAKLNKEEIIALLSQFDLAVENDLAQAEELLEKLADAQIDDSLDQGVDNLKDSFSQFDFAACHSNVSQLSQSASQLLE